MRSGITVLALTSLFALKGISSASARLVDPNDVLNNVNNAVQGVTADVGLAARQDDSASPSTGSNNSTASTTPDFPNNSTATGNLDSGSGSSSSSSSSASTSSSSASGSGIDTSPSGNGTVEAEYTYQDQATAYHNYYRAQYGAPNVGFSNDLYPDTLAWAQACRFQHSNPQGRYGENLAAGTPPFGIPDAMALWMNEASKYNYDNPQFDTSTGHFTQVVWKSTTAQACALYQCGAGTIFSGYPANYVVCRYSPPGNVQGAFAQNIGRRVQ